MTGPYSTAAHGYLDKGWRGVLPVGPGPRKKKNPPEGFTGREGAYPTVEQVDEWSQNGYATSNICLRLHEDLVGIDIDDYGSKVGGGTISAVEAVHGALPATWRSTSRGPDHRGINIYRIGPGSITKGVIRSKRDGTTDVEIIRFGHRYMLVYPSIHPDTGAQYKWYDTAGKVGVPRCDEQSIPSLPQAWVDHINQTCACFASHESGKRFYVNRDKSPEYARDEAIRYCKAGQSVHDLVLPPVLTLCWARNRGHPTAAQMLEEVRAEYIAEVTRPGRGLVRTPAEARLEWKRMTEEGHAATTGLNEPRWDDGPATTASATGTTSAVAPNLPAEFWAAREYLRMIRDAAWSRHVAPDGVLASILARVAASLPHTLGLPPTIGSQVGLSLLVASVAPSGFGKSAGDGVASELLPLDASVRRITGGSGEGMTEAFFETRREKVDGKTVTVREQKCHNLYAYVDEGSKTSSIAGRLGSTLYSAWRSIFSGADLGEANASIETRRQVPKGGYSVGLLCAFQPTVLDTLFADLAAGTPGRFLYLSATDPSIPDSPPPWPRGFSIPAPDLAHANDVGRSGRLVSAWPYEMRITASVEADIRSEAIQRSRGAARADDWTGHRNLLRLKTAALLAVMDGSMLVREDDWALAGMVVDTSDDVRRYAQSMIAAATGRDEDIVTGKVVRREVAKADAVEANAINKTAHAIHALVARKPGELSEGRARASLGASHRLRWEDGLSLAIRMDWVVFRDEPGQGGDKRRLYPGSQSPAR